MTPASILIVEDEIIIAADLAGKLRQVGYSVVGTTDRGETAIELVGKRRPDLVLMDIRLAGAMDGIAAAIAIRREYGLPVVFLTAHSDAETLSRAGQAEAFGFILKPFEDRDLRTHIEMALYKNAAEQRLREEDRRKSEFIAVLSHELRNPLAAIRNSLYLMDYVAPESAEARQSRTIIDRQVSHLARLVDDLLDVTRIAQNKIELVRKPVELNELVRRTLEDHKLLCVRSQLHCQVELAPVPLYVTGDAARLIQIVGNLLHNAIKFTRPGGTVTVTLAADLDSKQAVIRVADTGIGITEETCKTLFQPFVQLDKTLSRTQGGLGLGLALVKGLVELHGGHVNATSSGLGKGAQFTVRLPLAQTPIAELAAAPAKERSPSRHILIIEDNPDTAVPLCQLLSLEGHKAEVAANGPEGLDKALAHKPDVVLCDIGLPGMNGYEIAQAFRTNASLRSVLLVALTGYAQAEDRTKAQAAGFQEYLVKPVNLAQLRSLLSDKRIPEHARCA
jgi:signal transduction histidine kinase